MSYEGQSLADLVDHVAEASDRAGRRMAESMVKRGEQNIIRNTPVETHHLRDSYHRTEIRYRQVPTLGYTSIRWSAYAWEGTVFTEIEYAPYVELGTGLWGPKRKKYKIAPKKPGGVLVFTSYDRTPKGGVILDVEGKPTKSGASIVVRFVMHPGSPGQHMFKIGTTLTEHEKESWSAEPLRLWQQEISAYA